METKDLYEVADYRLESDGLMSWEEFYGASNEDLVESITKMYDLLIGRTSEMKGELINSQRVENCFLKEYRSSFDETVKSKEAIKNTTKFSKKNGENWSRTTKENWNCRCTEKSLVEAVTRCSACDTTEQQIRSTDIKEGQTQKADFSTEINSNHQSVNHQSLPILPQAQNHNSSKCELITCPASYSTPLTPLQQRLKRLGTQSPLSFKRTETEFRCMKRPSSVSSLASSSSSSSSSGTSSYFGTRRLCIPHKSSTNLVSIESLEDSDVESQVQKIESCSSSKESEGSEDSGVHSPCTSLLHERPRYCDPHLSYMDKVVMEIIETEEVYVGDLQKIIEGYLVKWRAIPDFLLADRLDCLFGNIEAIFQFNSLFLTELKKSGLDPVKVARCFVRNNLGFSVYTEYCTNYPRTVSLLTELMRQEGTVRLFRERQTALQHTLPLGSYLLKPVQRILKYHLLLQNIVKQYSNGFDGYKDIMDALRTMTEIAQHINDMKRRHEHEVRVQEIQSLLLGWEGEDLTTFGELCAEGTFRMYGAKAVRHIFLFDKMILITKKKERGILSYKTHINCSNLMLIESVPGEPLSFHIIPFDNPRLQYTLQCRNLEQKREWTLQLKRVILENYNAVIPSHARKLVMELGQNKNEDENFTNKILSKRQHLAPEYLEKRKQEKQKSESGLKQRLRRSKKSKTGHKMENQFNQVRAQSPKVTAVEREISDKTKSSLEVKRRKSEADMHLYAKDENAESKPLILEKNEKELDDVLAPRQKSEINTLEQIVTQILKQNKEFDKILRRQKHNVLGQEYEFSVRRRKKKVGIFDNTRNIQKTLKTFVNTQATHQTETAKKNLNSFDLEFLEENYQKLDIHTEDQMTKTDELLRLEPDAKEFRSTEIDTKKFSKISIEDEVPTLPSVWLRQQIHHLPTPTKKAGSLPRSFQIGLESSFSDPRNFRNFRMSLERPFTIASDKLSSTMLYESMERFCKEKFSQPNCNSVEDESFTESFSSPGTSLDHINIHPEYKIYRKALSANILKNVLSSMQNKLLHIKADMSPKTDSEKNTNSEKKVSRVVEILAKQYYKTLKNIQKKQINNNNEEFILNSNETPLSMYALGSSSIGAKLANFTETDYHISQIRPSKKVAALLGVRADSLVSLSPVPVHNNFFRKDLSAIKLKKEGTSKSVSFEDKEDYEELIETLYERTFDAIDEDLLKDIEKNEDEYSTQEPENNLTPPPVPAKPNKELVKEKMFEILQYNCLDIKKEDGNSSSQPIKIDSTDILSKGWVKQIVGKIQSGL